MIPEISAEGAIPVQTFMRAEFSVFVRCHLSGGGAAHPRAHRLAGLGLPLRDFAADTRSGGPSDVSDRGF